MLLTTISNMFVYKLIDVNSEQIANAKYWDKKIRKFVKNFSFILTLNETDKLLQVLYVSLIEGFYQYLDN